MNDTNPPRYRWFWIILIVALFALGAIWLADPFGEMPPPGEAPEPVATATAPSAEYTTAPEQEGVEVELPETTPGVQQVQPGE